MVTKQWTMPEWMEKYRAGMEDYLGGRTIEELVNNTSQNLFNNAPGAAYCIAGKTVVAIFECLHREGLV